MITYLTIQNIPDLSTLQSIEGLYKEIFQTIDHNKFTLRMTNEKAFSIIALDSDQIIGFKTGYSLDSKTFYSWIGGVLPAYRGRGIADELMKRQHAWCKQNGFQIIRTKTMNRWRSMLILNLKHGFNIIDNYTDEKGEVKIILEKEI